MCTRYLGSPSNREEIVARLATRATGTYPRRAKPQSRDRRKRLLERDVGSKLYGANKIGILIIGLQSKGVIMRSVSTSL